MEPPRIVTRVDEDRGTVTIRVSGPFDFNLHQPFCDAFERAPHRSYVVNLEAASYLDSSALGSLLQLKEFAEAREGQVVVEVSPGLVLETLEMAHFTRIMDVRRVAA